MKNQKDAAGSYFQLGVVYRMMGKLNMAEQNMTKSMEIQESLEVPEVYIDYENLAQIARDRGDVEAEARWRAKMRS